MDAPRHKTIGNNVIPFNYKLEVETNFRTFKFHGKEKISLTIKKKSNSIRLNSKELKIKRAVLKGQWKEQKGVMIFDEKNEELLLKFPEAIRGKAELGIEFEGINNDKLYGFYRSKYTNKKKTEYMLTSQFEAPSARAAFPCFDEPEFKATYDLSLIIDRKHDAVSNMPVKRTENLPHNKKRVTFHTTPMMSSYLLYMGVGKFEYLQSKAGKTKVRIVTTPGKKDLAKLSMKYTKDALADLERYFGIKYMLPKLDMIAVPDFAAGAMENWGAVTFRESLLLGDEKKAAVSYKEHMAEVITHELVHMWFGDLVTMQWWNDMWLNESFATFMAYRSVDRVIPEWKTMLKYNASEVSRALSADEVRDTHPISVNVNTVGQIEELFDSIGYSKGGSVLYMLEDFVGKEIFRKGLNRYLKENSYGNATKTDPWGAIEKESRKAGKKLPISRIMQEWVTKPGFPMVYVRYNGRFELSQNRFTLSNSNYNALWPIPIHYSTEKAEGRIVLNGKRTVLPDTNAKHIKLNFGQAGFYRVNYDLENLYHLGKLIREKKLTAADAWGVENDIFVLVRSGRFPVSVYLDFVGKYCMSPDYPLSMNVSGHLNWLISMAYNEEFVKQIKDLSHKYHKGVMENLGWTSKRTESSIDKKLRAAAIASLGFVQDQRTIKWAAKTFSKGPKNMDSDLKPAVYSIVAFNKGTPKMFNRFLKMYNNEKLPEDRDNALEALGEFSSIPLLNRALKSTLSKKVRFQDSIDIPISIMGNPNGTELLASWIKKNWRKLMRTYPTSTKMLILFVKILANITRDQKGRDNVKKFFANKDNRRDDIEKETQRMLEKIDANIAFLDANR